MGVTIHDSSDEYFMVQLMMAESLPARKMFPYCEGFEVASHLISSSDLIEKIAINIFKV